MTDPLWYETCRSTFKYFIILIISPYYILCISWIIKCIVIIDVSCLVCSLTVDHGEYICSFCSHRRCSLPEVSVASFLPPHLYVSNIFWLSYTFCLHSYQQIVCEGNTLVCFPNSKLSRELYWIFHSPGPQQDPCGHPLLTSLTVCKAE